MFTSTRVLDLTDVIQFKMKDILADLYLDVTILHLGKVGIQ